MSDNDLISRSHFDERVRLAAGPDADEEFTADFLDGVKTVLYMLSTEPAVPHEMTARELLLTEARMIYADEYAYDEYSRLIWNLKLDDAAAYAERWAKEHPERSEE